ncbi:Mannan endo-1,4-beta-mannosidase 1 [Monoraphidium neglectum]|uniref:mannan endo-1,4-beta-mannosidase n=1 Tax=Monoraphidium neglectum TaxID=145388 RepID=A0A0D2MBB7_9CHLO|nr:Mannan endo-1,4-beta-mannosidase 1 [Monoraphidium neglectum]KIZ00565.1 Mannan endo-1,4-beta-mannosidase 1 [Monoraphidium neglectum]|eukprot:XP_013899584.1 Mannan endo-1,4-beta-mannosidase 1 [Monoraphidium neglectum]
MALETLDACQRLGFSVIRTWAFNDGGGWNALQTAPGVYDENVFRGLDWVIAQCAARGLRLMLTLSNFWEDFGGFPQYVRWSRGLPPGSPARGEDFYCDPQCQAMYRQYVTDVVTRVNTVTGVAYRDDPTIFAWDLVNEPRNDGDDTCAALTSWIDAAAAHVKSLDPNHPVTVGLEGFFGPSTPGLAAACNPYNQTHGVDWVANNASPSIDFASIHLYADQWCPTDCGDQARVDWAVNWVKGHIQAAKQLGKPLCLQEFGKKPAGSGREALFEKLLAVASEEAQQGGTLVGSLVWMFAHESYPDYDSYTLYEQGEPDAEASKEGAQPTVNDRASTDLVVQFAQQLRVMRPS